MRDLRRLNGFKKLIKQIECDEFYYNDLETKRKMISRRLMEITQNELTKNQREVLLGIYFEKLPVKELAERMGVCISAVYRTHKRAIEKIKKYSHYMSLRS